MLWYPQIQFIVLLNVLCEVSCMTSWVNYRLVANSRLPNSSVGATVLARSSVSCCASCHVVNTCHVIAFHPQTKQCDLGDDATTYDVDRSVPESGWMIYYEHGCRPGWSKLDNACFYVEYVSASQEMAAGNCASLEPTAHLANIKTYVVNTFIGHMINGCELAGRCIDNMLYWIGGDKTDATFHEFVWTDGSSVTGYTSWGTNEPDGPALGPPLGEYCMVTNGWRWGDVRCTGSLGSVCEYSLV